MKRLIPLLVLLIACGKNSSVTEPQEEKPPVFHVQFSMGTNLTETDTCNIMVFNMTYWPEDTTKSRFDEHIEFEGFHTTDIYEFGEGKLIYILNEYLRVSPCVTHTNNRLNKWVSLDLFVDQELRDSLADTIHTAFDDLLVSNTFILEKEAD